ncbi:hypothetical protein J2Z49_001010 [Desulfofundulus luciae]|uniref:Uncharacterized protein n=1 Tax=Desulfofundulus luciae TaxID=74702 RepID=A0ABU0AZK7_9FIRM|nr:hypothetical protein [Desulfofundulus luciae]
MILLKMVAPMTSAVARAIRPWLVSVLVHLVSSSVRDL